MKPYKLLFLFLLAIFCSCNKTIEKSDSVELIIIRKNTIPEASTLSEVMRSVRIVPLETTDESLMAHIFQMEIHDNLIYMINYPNNNGVKIFNTDGKYIRSIGREGKGPGEFTELMSFSVLPKENKIYLTDRGARKTSAFDLEGKFIEEISTPVRPADLKFVTPDKYYVYYPKGHYMRLVSLSGEETKNFIPFVNGYNGYGNAIFTQADHSYLYSPTYHDSIYSLGKDSLVLEYAFDFGPFQWSGEEQVRHSSDHRMSYPPNKLAPGSSFFDFGKFLHFTMFIEDENDRYTIDPFLWIKEDDKLIRMNDDSDDILFCGSHNVVGVSPNNEWISYADAIGLIESYALISQNAAFKYPKDLLDQIKKLEEEDNPVLIFYTLKN